MGSERTSSLENYGVSVGPHREYAQIKPLLVPRICSISIVLVDNGVWRRVQTVRRVRPRANKGARTIVDAGLRSSDRSAGESGRWLPSSQATFSGAASPPVPIYRGLLTNGFSTAPVFVFF